jgi:hypothetical protein
MKTSKFIAAYIRKNIDYKPDYLAFYQYADGYPILFDTRAAALEKARSVCSDPSHACYSPAAIPTFGA